LVVKCHVNIKGEQKCQKEKRKEVKEERKESKLILRKIHVLDYLVALI